MSKNENLRRPTSPRARLRTNSAPQEKVGPGNPPRHTQFRKGVSGNAKGRPKGSKNLATLLTEAATAQVNAVIDGKTRKISKIQATTWQLASKAAGGDPKSVSTFLDWIDEVERRAAASKPAPFPLSAVDSEIIREIFMRMNLSKPTARRA